MEKKQEEVEKHFDTISLIYKRNEEADKLHSKQEEKHMHKQNNMLTGERLTQKRLKQEEIKEDTDRWTLTNAHETVNKGTNEQ